MSTTPAVLADRARGGDRGALARLLSLIEAGGPEAVEALAHLYPHTGAAWTIGITGAPGAGKSTLTDRLIARVRRDGAAVGVLAVDPSSPFSGGALLGDRVRMQGHATDPDVFIRSMASRGHLGGLALATPQAVRVLDAVGIPWVIIETVGVGQVEVEVAGAADTTVVVLNPGWGDGVQTQKAGLLEVADVLVVNKADRAGRDETVQDLYRMLALAPAGDWTPPVVETVATEGKGVDDLWEAIGAHRAHLEADDRLATKRSARTRDELRMLVREQLGQRAAAVCDGPSFDALVSRVADRSLDPYAAVTSLLDDPDG
ncbi:MAG TPA: methylmalonyl Co-A mutase-associated GTPase MeaB [Acidimicrobiia bacterium]|nr:methylmalonyl Co-A mutase-associated GTPase MeaB [Acidimicrobiia bacterium]